ncbi:AIPR family protein [Glycomyces sp. A-F 0318]|nr:AIPR family protein [Glycomyces amatae]MCD0443200.1 AIPR family protein [Glycomyces amatae]
MARNDNPMRSMLVRQLRLHLEDTYRGLIDLSDVSSHDAKEVEQHFRTRALAAMAVRDVMGVEPADAAYAVIDGDRDYGIDAIGVDAEAAHICLVQAKWSDNGGGSLTKDASLKIKEGFEMLTEEDFDEFNNRFQRLRDGVQDVLRDHSVRVTVIMAIAGDSTIADAAKKPLQRVVDDFSTYFGAHFEIWQLPQLRRVMRSAEGGQAVDLKVRIDGCGRVEAPYPEVYGVVDVDQIAGWQRDYGLRLFERNIRNPLGGTPVNIGIIETLTQEPENFLYFNNGITVLCESIQRSATGRLTPGSSGDFLLKGASIVNGAQSVAAIHRAYSSVERPEGAEPARIKITAIEVGAGNQGFADRITEATNTQNRIQQRDFAAQDQMQQHLKEAMLRTLGKEYSIKQGEATSIAPDEGCAIEEALEALACANPDAELATVLAENPEVLWGRSTNGYYRRVFVSGLDEYRLWRTVLLHRKAKQSLDEQTKSLVNRGERIAELGRFLVCHIVAHLLISDRIRDDGYDWDIEVLEKVPLLTKSVLARLIHCVNQNYGERAQLSALFRSVAKSRDLAKAVVDDYLGERNAPVLPDEYRKDRQRKSTKRQQNAVALLVQRGTIADGTRLEFRAQTKPLRQKLTRWLAQDPSRSVAHWRNDLKEPLVWEADGKPYSATGLVHHIIELATGSKGSPLQGTLYWLVPHRGSIADLAFKSVDSLPFDEDDSLSFVGLRQRVVAVAGLAEVP